MDKQARCDIVLQVQNAWHFEFEKAHHTVVLPRGSWEHLL